jgi:hypothetical protein
LIRNPLALKPSAINAGGHCFNAVSRKDETGSPISANILSAGISFVKLHRPLAVMRILDPILALRSKTRHPSFLLAAQTAANKPAAPPPIMANGTGVCASAALRTNMEILSRESCLTNGFLIFSLIQHLMEFEKVLFAVTAEQT